MDPKTLANLDPKLRETYERVMGAASASTSGATSGAPTSGATPPLPTPVDASNPATPPLDTFNTNPPIPSPQPVIFDAMPTPTSPAAQAVNPISPANPATPDNADKTASAAPAVPGAGSSPSTPAAPFQSSAGATVPTGSTPNNSGNLLDQPIQAAELASLQSSLTGAPVNNANEGLQLSKPLQPLPSPASVNQPAAPVAVSSTSPVMRTLYFIAAIVFFIVYAIFWLKIFRYPLPF